MIDVVVAGSLETRSGHPPLEALWCMSSHRTAQARWPSLGVALCSLGMEIAKPHRNAASLCDPPVCSAADTQREGSEKRARDDVYDAGYDDDDCCRYSGQNENWAWILGSSVM